MNRKYKFYALPMGLLVLALAGWPFDSAQGRAPDANSGADAESTVATASWDWHTIGGGGYWSSGTTYTVFSSFSLSSPFGATANSIFYSYSGFLFPFETPLRIKNDFDGDLKADVAVYRQADGFWNFWLSGSSYEQVSAGGWGGLNFMPVASDYDGDLKTDPAVYNTVTGEWRIWLSTSGYDPPTITSAFGGGTWLAAPADYDGDQITDLGIYDPASGTLKVCLSHNGFVGDFASNLGGPRYVPTPADYDGDRTADPAVHMARTGTFAVMLSGSGYALVSQSNLGGPTLGAPSYTLPEGDYDGDGKADPSVYQARTGNWYVWLSGSDYAMAFAAGCGGLTWTPVPGNYDYDACMDLGVYQQDTGNWVFWQSLYGYAPVEIPGWGGPEFEPVQPY